MPSATAHRPRSAVEGRHPFLRELGPRANEREVHRISQEPENVAGRRGVGKNAAACVGSNRSIGSREAHVTPGMSFSAKGRHGGQTLNAIWTHRGQNFICRPLHLSLNRAFSSLLLPVTRIERVVTNRTTRCLNWRPNCDCRRLGWLISGWRRCCGDGVVTWLKVKKPAEGGGY